MCKYLQTSKYKYKIKKNKFQAFFNEKEKHYKIRLEKKKNKKRCDVILKEKNCPKPNLQTYVLH